MICFPNAKINIGLNVLEKRKDGYHNIESIFYPVCVCDALEAMPAGGNGDIKLTLSGIPVPGLQEDNLCAKIYHLLNKKFKLPSLNAWLLKRIPAGSGLGGGSADAAFFLKLLNESFDLNLNREELNIYAMQAGSDCAFFLDNQPALVSGKGDVITPVKLDLSNYYISIIYPQIHVDTKDAYSFVNPNGERDSLKEFVLSSPIHSWKDTVKNDFEKPQFELYPELAETKKYLYKSGARYASMTGSGSTLYGIFEKKPVFSDLLPDCKIWTIPPREST